MNRTQAFSALCAHANAAQADAVHQALANAPDAALERLVQFNTKIVFLRPSQRFVQASPELSRLSVDPDAWRNPPAGLFVRDERALYVRSVEPMVIAHETGHALDAALGGGTYLSTSDEALKAAFAHAPGFVTPYAGSGADEWFAEGWRSMLEVNGYNCPWPKVSRARLRACSPQLYDYLERTFWVPEAAA